MCDLDLATTLANCIHCTYNSGNPWADLIKRSRLHDKGANDRVFVSDPIDYLVDTLVFVVRSIFPIYVSFFFFFFQFLLKYLTSLNCLLFLSRSSAKFQSTQVRTFFITNIHFALMNIFNAVENFHHPSFRLLFSFFLLILLPLFEKVRTCRETRLSFIVSRAMLIGF